MEDLLLKLDRDLDGVEYVPIVVEDLDWHRMFGQLGEFVDQEQRLPVYQVGGDDPRDLSKWCETQRAKFKKGQLGLDKAERLEEIDCWSWIYDRRWLRTYGKVAAFVQENGRLPKHRQNDLDEKQLAQWCRMVRTRHEKWLTKKQKAQVEGYPGWVWGTNTPQLSNMEKIKELKKFVRDNGRIPTLGDRFHGWVKIIKREKGKGLTVPEKKMLSKLPGWSWNIKRRRTWEENYYDVKQYVEQNGSYPRNKRLADWCHLQKRKKLSGNRNDLLEKLPNWSK